MNTNETIMTMREFLTKVIDGVITDEMKDKAQAELEKMDAALEKRKSKQSKAAIEKAAADAPMIEALAEALTDVPQTATDLMGVTGQNVQKTSHLLRAMVEQKLADVQDVKVKSKGTQKGYTKHIEE